MMTAAEIADYQRRLRALLEERRETLDELIERGRPSRRRQAGLS